MPHICSGSRSNIIVNYFINGIKILCYANDDGAGETYDLKIIAVVSLS